MNAKIGSILILMFIGIALFAPWIAPHHPEAVDLDHAFGGPSFEYLFGQDADGRDIFSRILYGTRISLGIGIIVTLISLIVGCAVGLAAGLSQGWVDRFFLFLTDVFLAFPSFLFAVAVAAFLAPSVFNVVFILILKGWVTFARLVRGQVLSLREREFVLAGRALGMSRTRLAVKHLFPNTLGSVMVNASFGMAGVILIESTLSFLGLGVPAGTPSWGAMLDEGTQYLLIAPHVSIFPGIFIMLVVLGFNFLGDGLRDRFAPRGK